jgi:hypothetical protein
MSRVALGGMSSRRSRFSGLSDGVSRTPAPNSNGSTTSSSLIGLTFERQRALPGGSVEIVYDVSGGAGDMPARDAGWSPRFQRDA